jgi:hypothetical protein
MTKADWSLALKALEVKHESSSQGWGHRSGDLAQRERGHRSGDLAQREKRPRPT